MDLSIYCLGATYKTTISYLPKALSTSSFLTEICLLLERGVDPRPPSAAAPRRTLRRGVSATGVASAAATRLGRDVLASDWSSGVAGGVSSGLPAARVDTAFLAEERRVEGLAVDSSSSWGEGVVVDFLVDLARETPASGAASAFLEG